MDKIHLLKIDNFSELEKDSVDESHPLFDDIADLLGEDFTNNVGGSDDECLFIRVDESLLERVEFIINKYTTFTKVDVSDRVISGEIQRIYPEVEEGTPGIFTNFRLDLTTIDNVLDKISEYGIESLDSTDMIILNR